MRYPPQFIDRLKSHFRLSEVIGKRISVKRAGREYMGLCPFHGEKTPSFTINDEKGFFHCFGCGAHGDVIGFIKDYEKISYRDAIERLAREAGMALPELTPRMKEEMERSDQLHHVIDEAAKWFTQQLRRTNGAAARSYLQGRGLQEEIIAQFRLGYAPAQRTGLKDAMLQKGISEALLREAGLLSVPDDGPSYDKFRGRVIFPIRDASGRVIAFGGRLMEAHENAPKYLNSPETPIFKKGYILFNADQARREAAASGAILVVEGYMDVIALAQAGFKAAVAPLGTAVTVEHLQMLWRMVDTPVFCLDGDAAGERAMQRVAEMALPMIRPGKSVKFALLPKGEDPDSLVQKRGREAIEHVIAQSMPLVEIIWRQNYASRRLQTPEERAGAEQELMAAVGRIQDKFVQNSYRQEMKDRLWRHGRTKFSPSSTGKGARRQPPAAMRKTTLSIQPQEPPITDCERMILTLAIQFPALLEEGRVIHALEECRLNGAEMDLVTAILHAHTGGEANRASLWAAIEGDGYAVAANALLERTKTMLPKQLIAQGEDEVYPLACEVLGVVLERREFILLNEEFALTQKAPSEAGQAADERLQSLKSELERRHASLDFVGSKDL